MSTRPTCEHCDNEVPDNESMDAIVTLHEAFINTKADLLIECPTCNSMVEARVQFYAG